MTTIQVFVPSEAASRSKMQKKGWKCWAKLLSGVASPANDGYAFSGDWLTCGCDAECSPGDVILHIDQSSSAGVGVVYPDSAGKGCIRWLKTANSDGRKWCASLGKVAREWLAKSAGDRLIKVAELKIEENEAGPTEKKWKPEVRAHYVAMAGRSPETAEVAPEIDLTALGM